MKLNNRMLSNILDIMYLNAIEAGKEKEVPVVAFILDKKGKNNICARNHCKSEDDCLRHAEIVAIENMEKALKKTTLEECTMFVTLEPCLMCMGAILNAGIKTLYYISDNTKDGALSYYHLQLDDRINIIQLDDKRFDSLLPSFFKYVREEK